MALSYLSFLAIVAILVLMVWKPGAPAASVHLLRPTAWKSLLLAHLAAVFSLAGGILATTVLAARLGRARAARELELLASAGERITYLVVWPALVVTLAAGVSLANKEDVLSRTWVQAGTAATLLTAVAAGIGMAAGLRGLRRRGQALGAAGDETIPPELAKRIHNPLVTLSGPLGLLLVVVAFWLMTTKPS